EKISVAENGWYRRRSSLRVAASAASDPKPTIRPSGSTATTVAWLVMSASAAQEVSAPGATTRTGGRFRIQRPAVAEAHDAQRRAGGMACSLSSPTLVPHERHVP